MQQCDDSLLQPNDQTYTSPIVSLDPPTILSKPITINIPCPWLAYEERNGKRNLRLLARLPRTPRKSTGDRTDYEWQDVTSKTALSIIGDNASFTTTEFTRCGLCYFIWRGCFLFFSCYGTNSYIKVRKFALTSLVSSIYHLKILALLLR